MKLRLSYPQALLGALAVVLLLTLIVAASTSTAAFGVYNPAWDGAGDLRDVAESEGATPRVAVNTSSYYQSPANDTVALVLSPTESYDERSVADLRWFLSRGGTLVVAEDVGTGGNELLRALGASARVDGRPVRDDRNYARSPALPVATNVTNESTLTSDVEQLTLNYGTVVEPNGTTVLVRTSEFAYLDANRNGQVDGNESLASYPVVTAEQVGTGRVIVVSDPSLFINAMLTQPDNRQFTANLFAREHVLLDYSHAGGQPPLSLALLAVRGSPLLQGGLLVLGVGAVVGGRRLLDRDTDELSHTPDPDRLARYLARERGWDVERARRLTTGVWGRPSDEDDNE